MMLDRVVCPSSGLFDVALLRLNELAIALREELTLEAEEIRKVKKTRKNRDIKGWKTDIRIHHLYQTHR